MIEITSTATSDVFAAEISAGIEFFTGGKDNFDFNPLTNIEELAVQKAWGKNIAFINLIAPSLAAQFMDKQVMTTDAKGNTVPLLDASGKPVIAGHGTAMVKFAGIAKAIFPENKAITFPGEPGTIVADWLTPQTAFYAAGVAALASGSYGVYADKAGTSTGGSCAGFPNTWDVALTANSPAYLFGGPNAYYTASTTNEAHSLVVLAQNGLIEYGTSPKLSHILFASQVQQKYTPIALQPLVQLPLAAGESNAVNNVYQYNTLGITPLLHNFGMRIGVNPYVSGRSHLQWLGMVFYEYSLFPNLASAYVSN